MYSKTKHFFTEKTIFFAVLAVILIFASGSASAQNTNPYVQAVYPEDEATICGDIINFTCDITKGQHNLLKLELYVNNSLKNTLTLDPADGGGMKTFGNVNVGYGYNNYQCKVYDVMGGEGASLIPDFTAEKRCEDCIFPDCTGCCPPGLVCRGFGGFPTPPEGVCECVSDITTTTTTPETTTTTTPETTTTICEGGCMYNETLGHCVGGCPPGEVCTMFQEGQCTWCECIPEPTVPEFTSIAVALIILLTTPAFAYLLIKRRTD